ncbi:DUF4291 family protein [Streptomyces sp. NPDC050988]|uniref:DUF4291 family protein n=1 Tax=Streptomyces sp. NPDC050988 TaxID=3365637 RepID=UPI0037A31F50
MSAAWRGSSRRSSGRCTAWDPERDPHPQPLAYRSLQLGLCGEAVQRYADEWTVGIARATSPTRAAAAGLERGVGRFGQKLNLTFPSAFSLGSCLSEVHATRSGDLGRGPHDRLSPLV